MSSLAINGINGLNPVDNFAVPGGSNNQNELILELLSEISSMLGSINNSGGGSSGIPALPSSDGGGSGGSGGSGLNGLPANLQAIASKVDPQSGQTFGQIAQAAVARENANGAHLTVNDVLATIEHESGGNTHAVGDNGTSFGLMQINNKDAANVSGPYAGQNRSDSAVVQIEMGTEDLANLSKQYPNDPEKMFEAYETGGDPNVNDGYGQESMRIMNGQG